MSPKIDWAAINSKLPYRRTPEDLSRRREMFTNFDSSESGFLSLAKIDRGMEDVIHSDALFHCKPAIMRAFQNARKSSTGEDRHRLDYLEFKQFRLFLQMLRQDFEYYQAFDKIDTGHDHRISREEFCAKPIKVAVEKWVGPIDNMGAEFDRINKHGGSHILFSDFIRWSHQNNLDLEQDDE